MSDEKAVSRRWVLVGIGALLMARLPFVAVL